ncbi:hypothetical protein MPTK1_1g05540 [Marchantia polymorpha subsp. ruderalis]|uniref:CUE domain-containing protein n=1 Tax=Marchantia polymorpha subsp. ruderalis TaxID=1480154 RepID=A0AAF6ALV1_MARPO|nr:hypothetical protein Mp_1g05540 [Marchantia polymorpha subsp. ruderalis]
MAWRASYRSLLDIFPQVDSRMLKAAALDHGDDLLSAADFILDEVLGTDVEGLDQEQDNVLATDGLQSAIVSRGPNAGEQSYPRNIDVPGHDGFVSGAVRDPLLNNEEVGSTRVNSRSFTNDGPDSGQGKIEGITPSMMPSCAENKRLEFEAEAVPPVMTCASNYSHCAHIDSSPLDSDKVEAFPQLCPKIDPEEKHNDRTDVDASSSEVVPFRASTDKLAVECSEDEISQFHCTHVDSRPLDSDNEALCQFCPKSDSEEEETYRTSLSDRARDCQTKKVLVVRSYIENRPSEDGISHALKDEHAVKWSVECDVYSDTNGDQFLVVTTLTGSDSGAANAQGFLEEKHKEENSDKVILESLCEGSTYTDPEETYRTSLSDRARDGQTKELVIHSFLNRRPSEDSLSHALKDELAVKWSMESRDVVSETNGELCVVTTFTMSGSGAANAQGFLEEKHKEENSDKVILESLCEGSTYTDPENMSLQDSCLEDQEGFEGEIIRNSVYDSILISGSTFEDETIVEGEVTDLVMASTKIMSEGEDDKEGGCWETLSNSSAQIASMETMLDAVDQAKADKEILIKSIEDLRALRQETDQAENEARWAKEEAAKGGLDVMSRVDKMREMLSQAREANEVHAAEVHGEKAVLATEARELRSRVVQLKREKEKALAVLNEIKASLQARISKACQEREAAVAEKVLKEALARECLKKEEEFMAQVAQQSRDLHAETETCNKLRELLIESGNIVDALQGEVAVLCEDAEELKEEIERMSLSCSSGFVHMLKPRPLSESTNSLLSKSSKTLGDRQAHSIESAGQLIFQADFAGSSPTTSLVGGPRNASDKRLPSLRRALSGSYNGSQDLSGSSLSSFSSNGGASNSGGSFGIVSGSAKISALPFGRSKIPDNKSSSSRSQSDSDTELKKLYDAQFPMVRDPNSDLQNYGTTNPSSFRTETSRTAETKGRVSSDDDDWHLLEMTGRSKETSSRSSGSSYAEN